MKIAFYAPLKPPDHPVPSGERTMARALIAALRCGGHDVELVSRFRSYDRGDPARQVRLRELGARLAERIGRRLENGRWKPDVWFTYHLYHKAPDWLGPALVSRLHIPYVVAEASFAPKQAGGKWDLGHRAVADAVGAADRVFVLNPADAPCLVPLLRSPDRLIPLRPFIETSIYREAASTRDRSAVASAYGLDIGEPWLVTAAMMRDDQKLLSYRCLAEALARIMDLPWRLLVAGAGPAEGAVHAAFASLGARVRWLGALSMDELRHIYAASDLYVWPAIKESWSMAILEAQAAGIPVAAGRSGGVPAVVADGETGLLAPEGDAEAFARILRRLLLDPALMETMGKAAVARAVQCHDSSVAADVLDRHLRDLVGKAGR